MFPVDTENLILAPRSFVRTASGPAIPQNLPDAKYQGVYVHSQICVYILVYICVCVPEIVCTIVRSCVFICMCTDNEIVYCMVISAKEVMFLVGLVVS